jgi:hypothetical protein
MKKLFISLMSGLALSSVSIVVAVAENDGKECKVATVAAAKCEKECKDAGSDCASCPVAKTMADLPQISYIIAGEASTCAKSAETAAEEGKDVKYVVANKELCCPTAAKDAHIATVEKFVASFASTHACEASGKTFVGNKSFECGDHAKAIATVAKEAMDEVTTVHFVGDKEFCCPTAAGVAAEKQGAEITYVVAGEKTQCAKTNRLNLAIAKYKAAVLAITKANSAEEADDSKS